MILRDPVYGLVQFEQAEQRVVPQLLAAREVQRLRRIRQLGLTSLAYPGADHTRFGHALGAAFVMTRFIVRMRELHDALPISQRLTSERATLAIAAALLHDVGHGPFSHLFEVIIPDSRRHEEWTGDIVASEGTEVNRILTAIDPSLPQQVNELVHGRHELAYLARAVSGMFDVDRCDYLLRDAYFTGVSYGRFDLDWLLRSLRLGHIDAAGNAAGAAPGLAIDGAKGLPAIESFILARHFMFQQVYFHKASRAAEWMMGRLIARMREVMLDGTELPGTPPAVTALVRTGTAALGEYLALDDGVMWHAVESWQSASDPLLADLCRRFCERRLFKTIELHDEQREHQQVLLEEARDLARARGLSALHAVGLDGASDLPFDDTEEPIRVIFRNGPPRRPGDVSFLLGRLRGQRVSRVRLVFHPDLREDLQRLVDGRGAPG